MKVDIQSPIDKHVQSIQVTEHAHAYTHAGHSYSCVQRTDVNALDIATPLAFLLITPNTSTRIHMEIDGDTNTPAYWELFEDNGVLSQFNVHSGNVAIPINHERNSSNLSVLTITTDVVVVVAALATRLDTHAIAKASAGGERHEYVLRQNTRYLVRATSYVDNNEGSLSLGWYERIH